MKIKIKDKEIFNTTLEMNSLIFGIWCGIVIIILLSENMLYAIIISGFLFTSMIILMGFVELIKSNIKISRKNKGE